jgi:predicted dinucleotide-binding enzyme
VRVAILGGTGSLGRALAARLVAAGEDAVVIGSRDAGHTLAAANLAAEPPEEDALVCSDDARAKELSLELAGRVVRGRALDAGPRASARAPEGLTAGIVNLNRRYKAHAGLRITGIP